METQLLLLIVVSSVFVVCMSVMTYLIIRKPKTLTRTEVVKVPGRRTVGLEELKQKSKLILDVIKGYNMEPARVFKNITCIGAEPTFEEDGQVIENDIVIPHRTVSSSHAQIVKSGSVFKILNRGVTNPVRVNGEVVVDDVRLNDGDIISLGAVEIKVIAQEPVTQSAAEAA